MIIIDPRSPGSQPETIITGYPQTALRWPAEPLVKRPHTVAELSGPSGLARRLAPARGDLAGQGAKRALGQLIHLKTSVVDEDGAPIPGAVVEIWHCNSAGRYIHPNDVSGAPADPNFHGQARLVASESGQVELRTIKPAAYPVPDSKEWWRPPHIHFSVWGKVWLSRLVTQMFFPGEPLNEHDGILNAIADPQARSRCIARMVPTANGPRDALVYEYRIVVRGRSATASLP